MMKDKRKSLFLFLFFGLVLGFINGLLGGGGGMLCVPILKAFLNLPDKQAHATSVLTTSLLSIATLVVYITTLNVNFTYVPLLSIGVLVGGIFGSILLKKFSDKTINIIFIFVMFIAGIKCVFF